MSERNPAVRWGDFHQVLLDLFRRVLLRELQPVRDAKHVRIDDDAARDAIGGAQDHIGSLARDTGQGQKLVHGSRHLAPEIADDFLSRDHVTIFFGRPLRFDDLKGHDEEVREIATQRIMDAIRALRDRYETDPERRISAAEAQARMAASAEPASTP